MSTGRNHGDHAVKTWLMLALSMISNFIPKPANQCVQGETALSRLEWCWLIWNMRIPVFVSFVREEIPDQWIIDGESYVGLTKHVFFFQIFNSNFTFEQQYYIQVRTLDNHWFRNIDSLAQHIFKYCILNYTFGNHYIKYFRFKHTSCDVSKPQRFASGTCVSQVPNKGHLGF